MVKIPSATKPPDPAASVTPPSVSPPSDSAVDGDLAVPNAGADRDAAGDALAVDAGCAATPAGTAPGGDLSRPSESAPDAPAPPEPATASDDVTPPSPAADDRRSFRVVITYKPAADGRWAACLAVGRIAAPGQPAPVDPVFETVACDAISDALDAVEGVYAAADARWAEQPRNPAASLAGPTARPPSPKQQAAIDASLQRREERQAARRAAREAKLAAATKAAPPQPPAPPMAGEKLSLF